MFYRHPAQNLCLNIIWISSITLWFGWENKAFHCVFNNGFSNLIHTFLPFLINRNWLNLRFVTGGGNNAKAYSFEITIFFRANHNLSSIKNLLMQHLLSCFAPCPFLMNFALFTFCTLLAGTVLRLCLYHFHFQQLNSPGITVHSLRTTVLCKGWRSEHTIWKTAILSWQKIAYVLFIFLSCVFPYAHCK